MRPDLAFIRRIRRRREPASYVQPNDLRLWDIRTAIITGIAAAVSGLAVLTFIAWLLLHQPGLPHAKSISLHDSISVLQLVFASVAGAGALVGLIVAYRRQKVAEADSAHDRTRVYNERFTTIAAQLGDDKPAVRLAGVHAMAGLADDWTANRQTCVDVLCAYLRMPYEPDPGDEAPAADRLTFQSNREVRHTVIRVITAHLKDDAAISWRGLNLDFTGTVFDGGNFSQANFSDFALISFKDAIFTGESINFTKVVFSGAVISFENAKFSSGTASFVQAKFHGGLVLFDSTKFSSSTVDFTMAEFVEGVVIFRAAEFCGAKVDFRFARFSGGGILFSFAVFSDGTVDFVGASFAGGTVDFRGAVFSGGTVDFSQALDWSDPPMFSEQPIPQGVKLPSSVEATSQAKLDPDPSPRSKPL